MLKICFFTPDIDAVIDWNRPHKLDIRVNTTDTHLDELIKSYNPTLFVTINSEGCQSYSQLLKSPSFIRRRWLHFSSCEAMTVESLKFCFKDNIFNPGFRPLISVFTPSYRSEHRIQRPYQSLLKQTYIDWEWVIIDDTDDNGDNLKLLQSLTDSRIRVYKGRHSGSIGAVKRDAAMLCRGDYLIELDHDDEIVPECLELIVEAFSKYPEMGMVSSYFHELYEDTLKSFSYGNNWGMGYGAYYKEWYAPLQKWIDVAVAPGINSMTMMHIVGVPNHVRAWRASVYRELNGHNPHLSVADDYDLIVRTFLKSKIGIIPRMLYLQYRNAGGNNFTNIRNALIQEHTQDIASRTALQIKSRAQELGCDVSGLISPFYLRETVIRGDILVPDNESSTMMTLEEVRQCTQLTQKVYLLDVKDESDLDRIPKALYPNIRWWILPEPELMERYWRNVCPKTDFAREKSGDSRP